MRETPIFTKVEDVSDNYIIGIVPIPNLGGDTEVHLYADTDGWLVAYIKQPGPAGYFKQEEKPAAKIMKWPADYSFSPPITNIPTTTLKETLHKAGQVAGVEEPPAIKYYDFRFPDANAMTLLVQSKTSGEKIIQVKIPADYTLYEASYYYYYGCQYQSGRRYSGPVLTTGELEVDGKDISCITTGRSRRGGGKADFGSYKGAIVPGVLHKIKINGNLTGGALATVIILRKTISNEEIETKLSDEILIDNADAVFTTDLVAPTSVEVSPSPRPSPVPKVDISSTLPQSVLSQLEAERSKRWAVLIGINQYQDTKLSSLKYAVNDVKDVYSTLTDPQVGSFDKERIHLLIEDSEQTPTLGESVLKEPTFPNIWDSLNSLVKTAQPGDKVFIYFSGHGIEEGDQTWLLASDSRLSMLDRTAISLDEVNRILSECQADSKILILDACHSGAVKDKGGSGTMTSDFKDTAFTAITGRATLSSSGLNESSYDYDEKRHSAFTYFLLEGLKGEADSDADNIVSLAELSDYVKTEVPKWGFKSGKQQTPMFYSYITGEIVLTGCSGQ